MDKRWRLYSRVAEVLLSIMGFICLGAEFVLRPAGGGDDRSELCRSRRHGPIIKPCHTESARVVIILWWMSLAWTWGEDREEAEWDGGWRSI